VTINSPAEGNSAGSPSAATILIVDDEEGVRKYFQQVLVEAGYKVLLASNGRKAITMLRAFQPDLVLMDLVMPEVEGIEAIMNIRRDKLGWKIIAISGAFGGKFLEVAKLLGADATLAKPVSPDELLQTVRRLLNDRP
jgi:CheY-like chemotaxis protein